MGPDFSFISNQEDRILYSGIYIIAYISFFFNILLICIPSQFLFRIPTFGYWLMFGVALLRLIPSEYIFHQGKRFIPSAGTKFLVFNVQRWLTSFLIVFTLIGAILQQTIKADFFYKEFTSYYEIFSRIFSVLHGILFSLCCFDIRFKMGAIAARAQLESTNPPPPHSNLGIVLDPIELPLYHEDNSSLPSDPPSQQIITSPHPNFELPLYQEDNSSLPSYDS